MDEQQATITKRGETVIQVSFSRPRAGVFKDHGVGLQIGAKVIHPVEALIRDFGTGEIEDVKVYGRNWIPPDEAHPLRIWDIQAPKGPVSTDEGGSYRMDIPGNVLLLQDDRYGKDSCVNLSFLRLVGISEGAGVMFGVKGVFTLEAIRELAAKVQVASRRFYISYMRPVDLTVMISTQEFRG